MDADVEERFRTAYRGLSRGELSAAADLMADDVIVHIPGRSVLSGDLRGKDAVLEMLSRMAKVTGGSYRMVPHDLVGRDDLVVVFEDQSCRFEGETYAGRSVTVSRLHDGKAVEVWVYPEDQYGADDFNEMVTSSSSWAEPKPPPQA